MKTISDVNPKINKVKFVHLRNSIRSIKGTDTTEYSYIRFKKFIKDKLSQTRSKIKVNLSCDKITPLVT